MLNPCSGEVVKHTMLCIWLIINVLKNKVRQTPSDVIAELRVLAGEAEEDGQEGADTHDEWVVEVADDR